MAIAKYALKDLSILEVLSKSVLFCQDNLKDVGIITLVSVLLGGLPSYILLKNVIPMSGAFWMWNTLLMCLSLYVGMGVAKYYLALVRGNKPELSVLISEPGKYLNYLIMFLRYFLVVMAGSLLLVIPGIYFAIQYLFVLTLTLDGKAEGSEAFVMSKKMTNGRLINIFIFFMAMGIAIMIASTIFQPLTSIVTVPVGVGMVLMYEYAVANSTKSEVKSL